MKLRPLTADEVRAEWDGLKPGIERVIAKTGAKFRPEDVYLRLMSKTAWAYAIGEIGGVVFTQEFDHDGLVLFIWLLWTDIGERAPNEASFYAQAEELGRGLKARRIRMMSPRKGWDKDPFFTQVARVYEHELT